MGPAERTNALPVKVLLVAVASAAARAHCVVAVGAVDRLVAARHERYLRFLAAVGASDFGHDALRTAVTTAVVAFVTAAIAIAGAISAAVVARCFLGCAAIGTACRLAEALLCVKSLLTFGEGESRTALAASKSSISHIPRFSPLRVKSL